MFLRSWLFLSMVVCIGLWGTAVPVQAEQIISLAPSLVETYVLPGQAVTQTVTLNQTDSQPAEYRVSFVTPENCHCTVTADTENFTVSDSYTFSYTVQTNTDSALGEYVIEVHFLQSNPITGTDGNNIQYGISHLQHLTITENALLTTPIVSAESIEQLNDVVTLVPANTQHVYLPQDDVTQAITISSTYPQRIHYISYHATIRRNWHVLSASDGTISTVINPGDNNVVVNLPVAKPQTVGVYTADIVIDGNTIQLWWVVYSTPLLLEVGVIICVVLALLLIALNSRKRN